jgi:hypothetical protein
MSFISKVLLVAILVLSIAFSAWIVAIPILAYLLLKRTRKTISGSPHASRPSARSNIPRRYLLGSALLVMSIVALVNGGRLSVLTLQALGWFVIVGYPLLNSKVPAEVGKLEKSTIVRGTFFRFRWFSVAEVKLTSAKLSSLLTTIEEDILVQNAEKTFVFIIIRTNSLTQAGADSAITRRLRKAVRSLAPLGGYLLPLDSSAIVTRFSLALNKERIEEDDLLTSLESTPFDLLLLRPEGGFVKSIGTFTIDEDENARPTIPQGFQRPSTQLLLWETLDSVEKRANVGRADSETAFLAGVYASRRMAIGQALESAGPSDAQSISVKSLTSPTVSLSRSQLRAIMKIYVEPASSRIS